MAGAAVLSTSDAAKQLIAAALVAVSAVCIGAWIALLSNAGYTGHDRSIEVFAEDDEAGVDEPEDGPDDAG